MADTKLHAPRGKLKASDPIGGSDPKSGTCARCGLPHLRCTAHNKAGKPCGHQRLRGAVVCRLHGGGAPQVIAKAEERLKALIDPAISRLHQLVTQTEFPSVAIAAVKDVLDRNGVLGKAREHFDVNVSTAEARVQRLVAARNRVKTPAK